MFFPLHDLDDAGVLRVVFHAVGFEVVEVGASRIAARDGFPPAATMIREERTAEKTAVLTAPAAGQNENMGQIVSSTCFMAMWGTIFRGGPR